jgi:hypothetical protein
MSADFPLTFVEQLQVTPRIESQHMPLVLTLNVNHAQDARVTARRESNVSKIVWQEDLKDAFVENVQSDEFKQSIDFACGQVAGDPGAALDMFVNAILKAAEPMKKNFGMHYDGPKRGAPWFDDECRQSKCNVKSLLRRWKRSKGGNDRIVYVTERTKHACLIREKKLAFERNKSEELVGNLNNQQSFWKAVKKINRGRAPKNDISMDKWVEHFKAVFGSDTHNGGDLNFDEDVNDAVNDDESDEWLNQDISLEEIKEAVRNLKNGKAPGPDCIIGEFLKCAVDALSPFLLKYFNHLFTAGLFPSQWTKALLVPLHKKGDSNDPNNYRGISLLSILSKCYTFILTKRLDTWAEEKGKIVDEQGGFRRGRSTVDHIFAMTAMVEKTFAKTKGKLYVAFVDFRKAYDLVNRNVLWEVLRRAGTSGVMLRALQAMYSSVVAAVRTAEGVSDEFSCPFGLKQGECSSPILFSFLINELAQNVIRRGRHGVQLMQNMAEIFLLLFADDVALVSTTPAGLQRQLDSLKIEADRLQLSVNLDKTNIVVFRKGGFLSQTEHWTYGGEQIQVVNSYKYLGLSLSTRLSTVQAVADFIPKAKRKIVCILNALTKINCFDWTVFCKIFDSQVRSGLMYASEIWGMYGVEALERVQLFAIKRFFKLSRRTSSLIVYGETGRFPLVVSTQMSCVRYWLKLLKLDHSRLTYQAYHSSFQLAERGKDSWAGRVRDLLQANGFGFAWLNQGVGNEQAFLKSVAQRLKDCYGQTWHEQVESAEGLFGYSMLKSTFGVEKYILCLESKFRNVLLKFRAGVSWIKKHRLRTYPNADISCPVCPGHHEDEMHVMFVCPLYDSFRPKMLMCESFVRHEVFISTISSTNPSTQKEVALFLLKCMNAHMKLEQL